MESITITYDISSITITYNISFEDVDADGSGRQPHGGAEAEAGGVRVSSQRSLQQGEINMMVNGALSSITT